MLTHNNRGVVLAALGRHEEALACFQKGSRFGEFGLLLQRGVEAQQIGCPKGLNVTTER